MELTLLLPLLASLQSLPRPVSPSGLPAPTLALEHQLTVLLPGQTATLTCQPPGHVQPSGYRFFCQRGQQGPSAVPRDKEGDMLVLTAEKGSAGTYTCAYWTEGPNGPVSKNSNSVSISIAAPQLTVSPPQPVYVAGEAVTLTCSAAGVDRLTRFRFYRDEDEIQPKESVLIPYRHVASIQLSSVAMSDAGVYSCEYWRRMDDKKGPDIVSERSQNISIAVTAPLPTPQLSVSPQQLGYVTGESITLTCSASGAPSDSMIRFYKDGQTLLPEELCLHPHQATASVRLSAPPQTSTYTCGCWRVESGRVIESKRSRPISIAVMETPSPELKQEALETEQGAALNPLPPPVLSVDPPSGAVSEGLPLLLTCMAPGNTGERRFPSYKGGSVTVSVTRVLRAGPSNVVEFTCGNKENVSGRWSPSCTRQAVNITVDVAVSDPLPPPVLSLDPTSGAVGEGLPLVITCTAPKGGDEVAPSIAGSEIDVAEPRNVSVNVTVTRGPSHVIQFTCGKKENGGWSPSPTGQAVNVTVDDANTATAASPLSVILLPVVGGVLLLLGLLAALLWWGWRKKRVAKYATGPEPSEPREHARNRDPRREKKRPEAAQMDQQGSEVAYAHIELSASNAHATKSKTRARPADEARVLYSEVATKPTHKAPK
nr:basement membrane-specific heparan sulfate proteoglycan core protein-like [Pelodiscus sinensis]|eukprot:XP_025044402.1 basement membrane-specific heparan sulfate proteoglycan core protein-like [Pelodiscus sinensis]